MIYFQMPTMIIALMGLQVLLGAPSELFLSIPDTFIPPHQRCRIRLISMGGNSMEVPKTQCMEVYEYLLLRAMDSIQV